MSKNLLTIEAFAEWSEKQPADKEYDYYDYGVCACAQYAATLGISTDAWIDKACEDTGSMWATANTAAFGKPRTFGALAKRLRSLSA